MKKFFMSTVVLLLFPLAFADGHVIENKYIEGGNYGELTFRNVTAVNIACTECNFFESHVKDSDLNGIFSDGSSFVNSDIDRSNIQNTYIGWSSVHMSTFMNATFENSTIEGSIVKDATVRDSKITSSDFNRTAVLGSNIKQTGLKNSYIGQSYAEHFSLKGGQIEQSELRFGYVESFQINRASLHTVKLFDGEIEKVGLTNVMLCRVWHDDIQTFFPDCE